MTEHKSVKGKELSVEEVFQLLDNRSTTADSGGNPTVYGESIAAADIGKCLRVLGLAPTEEKIKKLTEPFQGARVDVKEFTPIYQELKKPENAPKSVEELTSCLGTFDNTTCAGEGEHRSTLAVSTLRLLLTTMGEKMSDSEVDDLLLAFPPDYDGNIDIANFLQYITLPKE